MVSKTSFIERIGLKGGKKNTNMDFVMENKRKWSAGAIIWFAFMIFGQWIMFIEYATKPITKEKVEYQHLAILYFIMGAIGTALYLWLIFSKRKEVLVAILIIAGINLLCVMIKIDFFIALPGFVTLFLTFLIARKTVGFGQKKQSLEEKGDD